MLKFMAGCYISAGEQVVLWFLLGLVVATLMWASWQIAYTFGWAAGRADALDGVEAERDLLRWKGGPR